MHHDSLAPRLTHKTGCTWDLLYLLLCDQCIYGTFSYFNQEAVTAPFFLKVLHKGLGESGRWN